MTRIRPMAFADAPLVATASKEVTMQARTVLRVFVFLFALVCRVPDVHAQVSLEYSSFLGGIGDEDARGVAVAPDGCFWVCGYTMSPNFPLVNPLDSALGGSQDGFVCKFSPDGQTLLFSTYLGGSGDDIAYGIAADAEGSVYICGTTDSTDFPKRNAFQAALNGYWTDYFICKLDASGTNLVYSSYLGGSSFDYCYSIAVDTAGCAYVAGMSYSTDFPVVNPYQSTNKLASGYNFTMTKVASNGSSMIYSTYLGGSGTGHDSPRVAVTPDGVAYFSGATTSTNYPVVNPYQATHAGPSPHRSDVVVSVFSVDGAALTYSTYLGGSEDMEFPSGIAVGADGAITLVGYTQSDNFPVTNAIQSSIMAQPDLFVTRFTPAGDKLEFSTYLGGWDWDYGAGIALGDDGSVVAVGIGVSQNYPTYEAYQPTNAGGYEAVVSQLSPAGTSFVYSTYLGGSAGDYGRAAAYDTNGAVIVVGKADSANFPKVRPFQDTNGGGADAFISRLKMNPLHMSRISYTGGMVRVQWAGEGSVFTQRLMRTYSLDSPQHWSCIHTCLPGALRSHDTTEPSAAFFRVDMEKP